jgi:hypothetical protein
MAGGCLKVGERDPPRACAPAALRAALHHSALTMHELYAAHHARDHGCRRENALEVTRHTEKKDD